MREYSEYRWKENSLYYGQEVCFRITKHEVYEGLWWLVKPDGEKVDFYNIQRVKDNARKIDAYNHNRSAEEGPQVGRTCV